MGTVGASGSPSAPSRRNVTQFVLHVAEDPWVFRKSGAVQTFCNAFERRHARDAREAV